MYKWSNKKTLDTLDAFGEANVLEFKSNNEHAIVNLENGDIKSVIFNNTEDATTFTFHKEDSKHLVIGKDSWKRDVFHYLMPGNCAPTMRLGITHHNGNGTWSSLPHDFELNTEPGFEEIFFHILKGGLDGEEPVAWQRGRGVWYDNKIVDKMWPVSNHTFSTIPMGYHPVVGEPGVRVSYVWCYLVKYPHWEKI